MQFFHRENVGNCHDPFDGIKNMQEIYYWKKSIASARRCNDNIKNCRQRMET